MGGLGRLAGRLRGGHGGFGCWLQQGNRRGGQGRFRLGKSRRALPSQAGPGHAKGSQPAGQQQQAQPARKHGTPSRSAFVNRLTASPLQSAASLRLWLNGPDYTTALSARASGCKLDARQAWLSGCACLLAGAEDMECRPGRRWAGEISGVGLIYGQEESKRVEQRQVLAMVGPRPAYQRAAAIGPGSWNASVKPASAPPPLR